MKSNWIRIIDFESYFNYREMDVVGFAIIIGLLIVILLIRRLSRKDPIEFPDKEYHDLQNYTFNFTDQHENFFSEPKQRISLFAKIVLILIIIALILIPIGYFIPAFDYW